MQYHPHQKALFLPRRPCRKLTQAWQTLGKPPAGIKTKQKKTQTHQNRPLSSCRFHGDTKDNTVTVRVIVRGVRVAAEASGKLSSCKFKTGMHYKRAARDEAALQKDCRKRIFFSRKKKSAQRGKGGGGAAVRPRERRKSRQSAASVRRPCVIAVTSSLRVRRPFPVCCEKASLTLVDWGEQPRRRV